MTAAGRVVARCCASAAGLLLLASLAVGPAGAAQTSPSPRGLMYVARGEPAEVGVAPMGASALALAGEQALAVTGSDRRRRLFSIPVSGDRPPGERLSYRAPGSADTETVVDASPTTAAALFRTLDDTPTARTFAGPPVGPYASLGPPPSAASGEFIPVDVQVDEDRIFVLEQRRTPFAARVVVRLPSSAPAEVGGLSLGPDDRPRFAGDLVAVAQRIADQNLTRITIQNWRTAADRRTVDFPREVESLDLNRDGRVVLDDFQGQVSEIGLDGRSRILTRSGEQPAYAGNAIVFVQRGAPQRIMLARDDRRPRAFAIPSAEIDALEADASRVLWSANGCVLVAELTASATLALAPGPCPRSQLVLAREVTSLRLGEQRRVAVPLRCVAAPARGCRGSVRMRVRLAVGGRVRTIEMGTARVRLGAGRRGVVRVRVTERGLKLVRRRSKPPDFFGIGTEVRVNATDPAGRTFTQRECCARLVVR